jgi:K+-transporting ATPase ATPase C chain
MNRNLSSFIRQSWAGLRAMIVLTVVCGLLYPALVWGLGQVLAPEQAGGSLTSAHGQVVGSSLIGQLWTGNQWFVGRPSASGYSGTTSGGTNLSGAALSAQVATRAKAAHLDPDTAPPDALTASASGLDPHISPAYASAQVPRVAAARDLPQHEVSALVARYTQGRVAGFLGEPRVNVLELNLALARLSAQVAR